MSAGKRAARLSDRLSAWSRPGWVAGAFEAVLHVVVDVACWWGSVVKRRRQCPAKPTALISLDRWQCQRVAGHDGPHKASYSDQSTVHYSWTDGADVFQYETLRGCVRFRPPIRESCRAYRAGEWTAVLVATAGLWWLTTWDLALFFLVFDSLLTLQGLRRTRYVDVGRFTAMVYPAGDVAVPLLFGVAFARHGNGRNAPRCGLEVIVGRVGFLVRALMPRDEWRDWQARKKKAGRKGQGL